MLRGGLLALTFALAFAAFRGGVGVSERPGVPDADVLTHTYYALGLFVLGGLDIGVPTGGPAWLRSLLWGAYLLAPVITTSAVVEGALRVLRPEGFRRLALRDHVVVVGLGRLGVMFLEALRLRYPDTHVLVVERDPLPANTELVRTLGGVVVVGDARDELTIEQMQLSRARAVVMLTNDDLLNLDLGWRLAQRVSAPITAHVGNIAMRHMVERVSRGEKLGRMTVFNSHRIAAKGLHEQHLRRLFEETEALDVVVLAGFGRFGQTILEHLLDAAQGEIELAVVVDISAEKRVRSFRAEVDLTDDCRLETIEGDLDDPLSWSRVDHAIRDLQVEPNFVIGTDDDQRNLRAAIRLRESRPNSDIFVRCVHRSAFIEELSAELNLTVLSTDEMLRKTMSASMSTWIDSA